MRTVDEFLKSGPPCATGIEWKFMDPRGQEEWTMFSSGLAFARIARCIVLEADLVHLNTASRGSTYRNLLIALVATACRTPYIVHLHGGGYREFMAGVSGFVRRLVLQYFARAVEVVALTPTWGQYLISELGVPVERLRTLPNGTDAPDGDLLDAAQDRCPTFVFVGRLTETKGVPILIQAFAGLDASIGAGLLLVGGDSDHETEKALASAPDGVEVVGWVDHDRAITLMARARAVVLPSLAENMPLTVLEAMSVGTAVIASRVGGIPDILEDGVEGLLVDPGEPDQLRDALQLLGRSPERAHDLGVRGRRRWSREYDGTVMAGRLVECWRQVRA